MSKEERKIVSYHEVGHALLSALQKNSEPVQKITIVPRTMGALGYVMQVPEEEKYLNTKAELHDMLVGYLGGRAAEEIVFDTVTTGAANDIEKATNIAKNMVTRFGMSEKFGLMGLATIENQYLGGGARLDCSDVTAADVDTEVMNILKGCYAEAKALLSENRELMDKLAAHLIEKETITGKEFMKIYRAEKGIPEPEEEEGKALEEKDPAKRKEEGRPEAANPEGDCPAGLEKKEKPVEDAFSKAIETEQEKIKDRMEAGAEERKEEPGSAGNPPERQDDPENKDLSGQKDGNSRGPGQSGGPVGRFSNASGNFEP